MRTLGITCLLAACAGAQVSYYGRGDARVRAVGECRPGGRMAIELDHADWRIWASCIAFGYGEPIAARLCPTATLYTVAVQVVPMRGQRFSFVLPPYPHTWNAQVWQRAAAWRGCQYVRSSPLVRMRAR